MKIISSIFRIVLVLAVVWSVSRTAIFLLPGDPAEFLVHESLVKTSPDILREKMDLHRTALQRILSWPSTESLVRKEKAPSLVTHAMQNSLELAGIALAFTFFLSSFFLYLTFRNGHLSQPLSNLIAALASIPVFVAGPLLIYIFCIRIKALPPFQSPVLPAITLALYLSGFWYRTLQGKIERFMPVSPVASARARGLREFKVFFKYLLAPISGGFASFLGTQIGLLLNGSLMVEVIFQWPGIGTLLADSIMSRDYPVIELCLLITTLTTLLAQQLGYSLQKILEPKLG